MESRPAIQGTKDTFCVIGLIFCLFLVCSWKRLEATVTNIFVVRNTQKTSQAISWYFLTCLRCTRDKMTDKF